MKQSYWLTVEARDQGRVPLSGYLFILVEVKDVNDNYPMSIQPQYFARSVLGLYTCETALLKPKPSLKVIQPQ